MAPVQPLHSALRGLGCGKQSSKNAIPVTPQYIHGTTCLQVLVGNKLDLEAKRAVSRAEGQALADEFGFRFVETSAKDNTNVEEVGAMLRRGWTSTGSCITTTLDFFSAPALPHTRHSLFAVTLPCGTCDCCPRRCSRP